MSVQRLYREISAASDATPWPCTRLSQFALKGSNFASRIGAHDVMRLFERLFVPIHATHILWLVLLSCRPFIAALSS